MALTFIDLFSGCGGFSLGLHKAGFQEIAAIDFDHDAITVFKHNFKDVPFVLEEDLTLYSPKELSLLMNTSHVDVIVGGPPCQGFSNVRQVDGSNSGKRLIEDNRRSLFQEFLKFVEYFQPKIFVMENVPGIKSAVGGAFFTKAQNEARKLGYRVHSERIKSWEYGVPQKRERQLIIGTLALLPIFSLKALYPPKYGAGKKKIVALGEAIGDLPILKAGEGEESSLYDLKLRNNHMNRYGTEYLHNTLEIDKAIKLTSHKARPHSARDLRDFQRLREGENSAQAIARGEIFEFPYSKDVFKDRYTRQSRYELCSTILAHMSKDGLMFIHPNQNRSLTPREAARIQSFPDWFVFPVSRTSQFKLIGNAVPPLVGMTIGNSIKKWFELTKNIQTKSMFIPQTEDEAIKFVIELEIKCRFNEIRQVSSKEFLKGWLGIFSLFRYLHPDNALDINDEVIKNPCDSNCALRNIAPHLMDPVFARSGWPVSLVPLAKEAKYRLDNKAITEQEYYCESIFLR